MSLVRPALSALGAVSAAVTFAIGVYQPPVSGPVVDRFRPPPAPWAAGNRGIDYATAPGAPVRAAADGVVVFAGKVGGSLHVVVLHADGVRTSYSFLRSVLVHAGDSVVRGEPVGTAGAQLHFGARVGDEYVDPSRLFGGVAKSGAHLVPDHDEPDPAPH